jgi:hypothetical protein
MDSIVTAVRNLFGFVTGVKPEFRVRGGSAAENLALQNIQVSLSSIWLSLLQIISAVTSLISPIRLRLDCEWYLHICLHSYFPGSEENLEVY